MLYLIKETSIASNQSRYSLKSKFSVSSPMPSNQRTQFELVGLLKSHEISIFEKQSVAGLIYDDTPTNKEVIEILENRAIDDGTELIVK